MVHSVKRPSLGVVWLLVVTSWLESVMQDSCCRDGQVSRERGWMEPSWVGEEGHAITQGRWTDYFGACKMLGWAWGTQLMEPAAAHSATNESASW